MKIGTSQSSCRISSQKLIAVMLALLGPTAFAGPVGGNITTGIGTIDQVGTTTTITQQSQNLAIDWQSFSIGATEAVHFDQPDVTAIALNRVLGQDASSILGSLSANGQVFILNPNGVLFGSTAQVSVGGLVASTLNISDADFIAGNYSFTSIGNAGTVVNQGTLNASDGGYIAMIAPQVRNDGTIAANAGDVLLAAADKVTLSLNNGSLLSYTIDQGTLNALAENNQLIRADCGQVILTAQAADTLSIAMVNHTGIIEARTVSNASGIVRLLGDAEVGTINASGIIDASAPTAGDGGLIEISAANISADASQWTVASASGNAGTIQFNCPLCISFPTPIISSYLATLDSISLGTLVSNSGAVYVGGLFGYNTGSFVNSYSSPSQSGWFDDNAGELMVNGNSGAIANSSQSGIVGSNASPVYVGTLILLDGGIKLPDDFNEHQ